jgi:hypothetical protein
MSLALLVYAISTLTKLSVLLSLFTFFLLIVTAIVTIFAADRNDTTKMWKWALPTAIAMLTVVTLIPSEKTAYTMVGAYAAQKVAEDPKVQQLSGKVLQLIENKLDSYIIEQTKPSNKSDAFSYGSKLL